MYKNEHGQNTQWPITYYLQIIQVNVKYCYTPVQKLSVHSMYKQIKKSVSVVWQNNL